MKTVLITGSASGFGMLTAIAFAKKGYQVIATMRDTSKRSRLETVAKEENVFEQIFIEQLDVTNLEQIELVKEKLEKEFPKLDCLVNNAGYCQGGFFEDITPIQWQNQLNTNVFGVINVTRAFLPLLRKSNQAKIINISSVSGIFGFPGMSPYTTSKFALEGFSESLRLELKFENISVVLVEPASFATSIWEKSLQNIEVDEKRPTYQQNLYKSALSSAETDANPNEVAELIVKISEKNRPKFRYPVGKGAKTLSIAKRFVPWSIIEMVVKSKLLKEK